MFKMKTTIMALAMGIAISSPASAQFSGDLYQDCLSFAPDYATQYYRSRVIDKRTREDQKRQNQIMGNNGMTKTFVEMADLAVDAAYDAISLETAYVIAVGRCRETYDK